MSALKVLIADDEAPARAELRYALEALAPGAEVIEAADGAAAVRLAARERPDVAFLDIRMPELDGLGAAAALLEAEHAPLVVFATAYDEHAVRAFELAALDYVVKPVDEARLARTLRRIRSALDDRAAVTRHRDDLRAYLAAGGRAAGGATKLWAERTDGDGDARVLVDAAEIACLEAADKQVRLRTADGRTLRVRTGLAELEARLADGDAAPFVRVHRAYLVNLDHVAEVEPYFSGTYVCRLRDPDATAVPVSRRHARRLREVLGW